MYVEYPYAADLVLSKYVIHIDTFIGQIVEERISLLIRVYANNIKQVQ